MASMNGTPELCDTHFHSTSMIDKGLDATAILRELADADAGPMVDVAIEPEDFPRRREISGGYPEIVYSAGLHPSRSDRPDWRDAIALCERQVSEYPVHAIGELGLDWYREYAPRDRQIEIVEAQLDLARRSDLPVIVHNREADADIHAVLRAASLPRGGVMHCYSSTADWVRPFLDLGMYISFAGNITFPSAGEIRQAVAEVPADRLLLETDAPFLAPVPRRGRPNHPGLIVHTYELVAQLRGTTVPELARLVAGNARRLFSIAPASRESVP